MNAAAIILSAIAVSALLAGLRGWYTTSRRLARRQRELATAQELNRSLHTVEAAAAALLAAPADQEATTRQRLAAALEHVDHPATPPADDAS